MLDGVRRAKLETSVSAPSNGMKKTKFLYPRPFRLSHNPRHRSHGNLVRTGYQGGRRCRAGRVAETRLEIFIRGPGPFRGSPAPAEATAGAPTIGQDHRRGAGKAPYIYFTRCRPSAPLPDCSRQGEFFDNSQTGNGGVATERLAFSHIEGCEAEEPSWNQTIPQQGKRVNRARWLGLISYYLLNSYYTIILWG